MDTDVRGISYEKVTKNLQEISKLLFLKGLKIAWRKIPPHERGIPLFITEEIKEAILKMNANKAPGPDGLTSEVIKYLVKDHQ